MARSDRKPRKRGKRKAARKAAASGGKVRISGHTRSPRGPDRGKKPVRVRGYRRRVGKRR